MPGDNIGELIGEFLDSLLNPQQPGQGKPHGPGQPGPGQLGPGQPGPGQLEPGQPVPRLRVPRQGGPMGGGPMGGGPRGPQQRPSVPFPSRPLNDGSPFSRPTGAPSGTWDASRRDAVPAEVVEEPVTGDDVAAHVDQYLDPKRVTSRSERFGEEVALADDHLDAHQRELFGQGPRGGLSAARMGTTTAAAPTSPSAKAVNCIAQDVAALVRAPQNLRAALILGEILRRPDW